MITGISIENFKGISERVTLDLRPITLLFGGNSAGKSTVMHALLYFYEVFVNHNLDADRTDVGGTAIHLGGFRNLQSDHDRTKPIILRVDYKGEHEFEHEEEWQHSDLLSPACDLLEISADDIIPSARPNHLGIELTIAWNTKAKRPFVERTRLFFEREWFAVIENRADSEEVYVTSINLEHSLLALPNSLPDEFLTGDKPLSALAVFWRLFSPYIAPFDSQRLKLRHWKDAADFASRSFEFHIDYSRPVRISNNEKVNLQDGHQLIIAFRDVLVYYFETAFSGMKGELSTLKYIGPIREVPPRHWPQHAGQTSWATGLAAWEILHRGVDGIVELVSSWFSEADKLNAGISIERISYVEVQVDSDTKSDIYRPTSAIGDSGVRTRIVLKPVGSQVQLSLHDVGTGISQLLPIVVGAAQEEYSSSFLIEQPELHVHPRLQAAMADLFVEAIGDKLHTFIIETHSEHLILRLLRRIRETEKGTAPADRQLRTDELGIYYLKQENVSSTASRIDVDVKGEFIQPWPDDFFEIDFYERFA